jgi:hypothetical protein
MELGNAALDSGHYLAALEAYNTVREFFPDDSLKTPELALKIQHCNAMLGRPAADKAPATATGKSELSDDHLARLQTLVASAKYAPPPLFSQQASPPNVAADDYAAMPPSADPLGLMPLIWQDTLPGSRTDNVIYSQPVVTENSVIYGTRTSSTAARSSTASSVGCRTLAGGRSGKTGPSGCIRTRTCWSRTGWCSPRSARPGRR